MKSQLRIIGGKFRGKKFAFPEIEGLRPTPDRVRETLFNWLMNDIQDARCLDAFAGSGALGLESFSRGAKKVDFIENNVVAYTELKKNIQAFNSPHLQIFKQDSCDFLNNTREQFDIIFFDPPFTQDLLPICLNLVIKNNVLTDNGLIYIESGAEPALDPLIWDCLHLKKAGQVFYGLIQKNRD